MSNVRSLLSPSRRASLGQPYATCKADTNAHDDQLTSTGGATFAYDAEGRRVSRTAGGVTTSFLYDGDEVLLEQGGATTTSYSYGNALTRKDGETALFDGLGSERTVTNTAGASAGKWGDIGYPDSRNRGLSGRGEVSASPQPFLEWNRVLDDVVKQSEQVEVRLRLLSAPLDLPGKQAQIAELEAAAARAGFWDDPATAQGQMQQLGELKDTLAPWLAARKRLDDARTLAELAQSEDDREAYTEEVAAEVADLSRVLDQLEIETLLSDTHDAAPAILEINAGAGGTEANDWASILLRMYLRWADRHKFKVEMMDEVAGEEAGIKSTTLRVEGKNAYGLLKGEHGVHRLVRLSPFNANNKRQTSFAGVDVVPEVADVEAVDIPDKDLEIDYFRASGAGGQHVNKTSSAVRIKHVPTGIVVACQNERSQGQNKAFAMGVLAAKLLQRAREENVAGINEIRGEQRGIEFGSQIRNYVFQPYTLVKDTRTAHETGDIIRVMNGEFDDFLDAYLHWLREQKQE